MNESWSAAVPFCTKNYQGLFSGYASTYIKDAAGDQIIPGAFQKTLWTWKTKKRRFPHIYWEHDMEEPIGVCLELKEDSKGLFLRGKLIQDFLKTKEVIQSICQEKRGISIGFFVQKSYFIQNTRKITEIFLKEISLVQFPCNAGARVEEIKSASPLSCQTATKKLQHALHRLTFYTNF
ncbi:MULTISPECIES: HK97 family phage prohead protease [Holospora]|uniref:Putative prohead protease n=2 Tax=Holospora TaxID=44747 RepID=A0A061JH82_9PROT|nr:MULTISPECIES: HK97 family phage prohead protease [Holospora]ETZ04632.1 putative prohead protease [Holospora undulata HU1]GAJ46573.1 putative prohead protease [Holospora elegans E1]